MLELLQAIALVLTTVALVPALAHALEMPGKMRLAKDSYFTVQSIYYPGFTIAGIAEPLAPLACIGVLVQLPRESAAFWLTLAALLGLIAMQAVYWFLIHPVNKVWLQGEKLSSAGAGFFAFASGTTGSGAWQALRSRWEYSHVARACLAGASFLALVVVQAAS